MANRETEKSGVYIVTNIENKVTLSFFAEDYEWYLKDAIAWCPLSDIEPYKE